MTTARAVALRAIARVIDEGAYSNRLIPSLLGRSALDERDRAFAAELAYGTLRARLVLDRAIDARASRPVARMTPGVAHVLRLGAYQLLLAGVPAHAAVGETVELAGGREKGFANAVLRRLASDPPPVPSGTTDEDVVGRTGLARWAVRELRAQLGAEAESAAAAFATKAPLCLRANDDRDELVASLTSRGHEVALASVDPSCVLVDGGDPSTFPGYEDGAFAVQDQASAFVVRVLDPHPGDAVVDVCAAPGGKAIATARMTAPSRVIAADLHPRRLAGIRREAARQSTGLDLVLHDALAPPFRPGAFDRVLVDAPCSGIGSARRRPELLWRVPEANLTGLAHRQLAIAEAAADLVAPGGRLVYSVCTFPRLETDAVVDLLLRRRPELRTVPTPGPAGSVERHRLWPHRDGSDGMYVVAFERAS